MENKKFIIFLDVDGVLVSYERLKERDVDGKQIFVKEAIESLNKIIKYYDADLCMISAWNTKFKDNKHYKEFLISRGILVNGLTKGDQGNRYDFVLNEIKEKELKHYLIIDDEAFGYYEMMPTIEYKRILMPNMFRCLDSYDAKRVIFLTKLNMN